MLKYKWLIGAQKASWGRSEDDWIGCNKRNVCPFCFVACFLKRADTLVINCRCSFELFEIKSISIRAPSCFLIV
jgi:hypothetical protein